MQPYGEARLDFIQVSGGDRREEEEKEGGGPVLMQPNREAAGLDFIQVRALSQWGF